jgi:hypothetical protein
LGIEAQREALSRFAQSEGLDLVAEFVEVETLAIGREHAIDNSRKQKPVGRFQMRRARVVNEVRLSRQKTVRPRGVQAGSFKNSR